jgi:hydantoinase/carbamoylase family amidase
MPIHPDRILADIDAIATFSECPPSVGYSRPTFSVPWVAARDYVIEQATAAGCKVRIDAAGNVHARPAAIDWNQPVWLSGSHVDSVPTGGKYDGVMGIVVPLAVLRDAHEWGRRDLPLELVLFAEEEGTTFGLGMIGSRLWTGALDVAYARQFHNRDGHDFLRAGEAHGVDALRLDADRLRPGQYRGFIEVHAEQGPALWERNQPVAVVTSIAGRKQFKAKFMGVPNHAGSTPMRYRSDALVPAAKVIAAVPALASELSDDTVITVGRIECEPNAINVVPGTVRFTVDLRSPSDALLAEGQRRLEQLVIESGIGEFNFLLTEDQPAMAMDSDVCARLRAAGANVDAVSGALHDAAILAPLVPTAMLLVASRDGISHNPAEFSRIEDIVRAATILAEAVKE